MRNFLIAIAVAGIATSPALSQNAPQAEAAEAAKAKTVTKLVCKRVEEELGTGSRLGTQSKICREVVVSAPDKDADTHKGHSPGR